MKIKSKFELKLKADLDDHVVRLVHVELDLGPGVGVSEAELGLGGEGVGEALDQLGEVHAHPAHQLRHDTDVRHLAETGIGGSCFEVNFNHGHL